MKYKHSNENNENVIRLFSINFGVKFSLYKVQVFGRKRKIKP